MVLFDINKIKRIIEYLFVFTDDRININAIDVSTLIILNFLLLSIYTEIYKYY